MGQTLLSYLGLVPLITGLFFGDLDRGFDPVFPSSGAEVMHLLPSSTYHRLRCKCSMLCGSTFIYLFMKTKKSIEKHVPDKYVVEKALLVKLVIWLWDILPMSNGLESIPTGQKVGFANLHHCSTSKTPFMVGVLLLHNQRKTPTLPRLKKPIWSINETSTGRPLGI